MPRYALLVLPATNRVYAEASVGLTRAELGVVAERALDGRLHDVEETVIGGVPYVGFSTDTPLAAAEIGHLSQLSSMYALFEIAGEPAGGPEGAATPLLRPVGLTPLDQFDDDLLTIQKYAGKTNELFTKLLLNVTVLASASAPDMLTRKLRILDPLCGRGTTLNQALMYGYDVAGMEIDGKDVEAYSGFLRTWLKRKRIKHQAEFTPIRRERKIIGRRLHVTLAADKAAYKSGETLDLTVVNADTVRARDFFRPRTFDAIVTDAPYGVQHGSHDAGKLSRGPLDLLRAAVPGWVELLRPGGALGMSWNTYVARREDAEEVLAGAGLRVCDSPPFLGFRHRVDQAINRDVVVATKPEPQG
ncbi:TRM11 family SAM-dependent methyltransferase [Actinopolymorpha pittospori]|uniref:SAM-dependent methyltransferase n=1 Tax=Actinopolymorpha pittospori TaxID=648752 RepID=A0A927N3W8_9ACTN|nr:SAM-dependent methyltransferase [Actinopolymorpha pittospori]MBE1611861.1 SAM-dependent methyltransferase [Actinopolymorpha pittospori]